MLVRSAVALLAVTVMSQACNKAQRYDDERMGAPAAGTPAPRTADTAVRSMTDSARTMMDTAAKAPR